MFRKGTKYPSLQINILSDETIEVKVDWPKSKNKEDVARDVANFFAILDNGFALKEALEGAIIERGVLSKDKEVADAALHWGRKYNAKAKKKVKENLDELVIHPTKTLEP